MADSVRPIQLVLVLVAAMLCSSNVAALEARVIEVAPRLKQVAPGLDAAQSSSVPAVIGYKGDARDIQRTKVRGAAGGPKEVQFKQFHKGVPVYGSAFVLRSNPAGKFQPDFAVGSFIEGLDEAVSSVTPQLTPQDALNLVLEIVGVLQSSVQHLQIQLLIFPVSTSVPGVVAPSLVYRIVFYFVDTVSTVSKDIGTMSDGKYKRPGFIVDANTGKVLHQWDAIMHKQALRGRQLSVLPEIAATGGNNLPQTGPINYAVNAFDVDKTGPTNICFLQNDFISTRFYRSTLTTQLLAYQFDCSKKVNECTGDYGARSCNGGFSPLADVHFGVTQAFLFLNERLNEYSPGDTVASFGLRLPLEMRVHYDRNLQNAFWNGVSLIFGNGASDFAPLTSLDVAAHELGHAITETNSGLEYFRESGGMNEAFSDILAKAVEFWVGDATVMQCGVDSAKLSCGKSWRMGADIAKPSGRLSIGFLRDMRKPEADGRSAGCYNGNVGALDVHYSSGVYNKAYVALATTPRWNPILAFKPFLYANDMYWVANEGMVKGAEKVIQAAVFLAQQGYLGQLDAGTARRNVAAAFGAVNIGGNCRSLV